MNDGLGAAEELVLITRGRRTGREHRVRLWFAQEGDLLWLRADETPSRRGPDWYQNLIAQPRCRAIVGQAELEAVFEPSLDLDGDIRHLVALWRAKYGPEWVQDWYVERGRVPVKLRIV